MIQIETSQLITIWVFITANILIGAGITLAILKIMRQIGRKGD